MQLHFHLIEISTNVSLQAAKTNPLPWVEEMINAPTHGNFFENRVTDYAKGAITGDWQEVWGVGAA